MCAIINFSMYTKKRKERKRNMFEEITNDIRERRKSGQEYTIDEMGNISRKFLNQLSFNGKGPVPIVQIAKSMGFKIYQQPMETRLSGFIAVDEELKGLFHNDKIISVNINDEIGHQRFVIAHELAHYLFDYCPESKEYYDTYVKDTHETDSEKIANRFAAELLMPKSSFIEQFRNCKSSSNVIDELKKKFQVQDKAIIKRLREVI